MSEGFVIAIDGPVAAGKGTIASKIANEINAFNLYTGAMYRGVALYCIERGIDYRDEKAVADILPEVSIRFENNHVMLNNVDVTERIKKSDTAAGSSVVAAMPKVRKYAVKLQQEIGTEAINRGQIVVIEGRDTGTVVFPNAALRVFLTATDVVRAKRRLKQYTEQGDTRDIQGVLEEIRERDARDKGRATDPLASNPEELGYFILDDSEMDETYTLESIKTELKKRNLL